MYYDDGDINIGGQQYTKNYCRHSKRLPRPPWIVPLILVVSFIHLACSSITCGSGIKSPGMTVPRGDIVLEYGNHKPLEITCILDPDNEIVQSMFPRRSDVNGDENRISIQPSQKIQFFKNEDLVPAEYVTIVNSTAARLFVPDPPAGLDIYYCMLLNNSSSDPVINYDQSSTLSSYSSTFSTVQPNSQETSSPSPIMSEKSAIGVCLNRIAIGYKPFPISNFSCISYNWVSLRCNWTKPQNPVVTTYKLFFRLPGRAGNRISMTCPNDTDTRENTCYWDEFTEPIYRKVYEYYNFTLTGENIFGTSHTSFVFHHYANVIPASPMNITVLDKTQSSAMLRWSVGVMSMFPRNLVHKIEYKSQWDSNPEHWHSVNENDVCNASLTSNQTNPTKKTNCRKDKDYYYFNVTDLKYPFTHYDFRIYVRSSVAHGEDKWSAPGCITLKTKPTIPRRPPRTDIGSFECVPSQVDKSTRDVYIYWQNIDDSEKCGDLFEYRVYYTTVMADNITIIHSSNETYKNYAKFDGLNTSIGYTFTIYSANEEGLSSEYSTVYVPSESDKLGEPLSFTKMAFDNRGVFELSWKNDSNQKLFNINQLNDYTIFWCENDQDRPYQCNGYMNWMHIPSSESCYNITLVDHMKIYQFAISANSKILTTNSNSFSQPVSSSSGMVWASCTVLHNKIVGKIKNFWINMIGSTMMELRWKLDCSDRIGAVLGFRIFYCSVVSINNSDCKETTLNKVVSGEIATIENLKPYTTYKLTIALITKHGEGLQSDPMLNTTLEGAPDIQDIKISVTGLTNTSVTLKWLPPKCTNGIIRYYHIHYYIDQAPQQLHQSDLIDESLEEQQSERSITVHEPKCLLENLESYIKYKITITACTTVCSNRSIPIQVQTAVGLPGRVSQPTLLYENSTRVIVSWARPMKPAGPIDYYELIVAYHSEPTNSQIANGGSLPTALASKQIQENHDKFLYHSDSTVFPVPVPNCNDEHDEGQQTFSFFVRAVNKNPFDPQCSYYGPWSAPGITSCILPGIFPQ
ncbi:Fibronectin type III,Immunoglobulin-like fold [Cinara cedri]|uniref:Fibronectin type III,Immunoglobulin-like fold n=1 Tax=Cinara cedri TaxID=506608 RepID=A0A5E4NLI5_9HEMI|nr:Fibronectin type III,Immunoglobulin-like fold [Cinara cedri]